MHRFVSAGLVLLISTSAMSQPQTNVLTLESALERARQSSPALIAARLRIDEARGRVIGATLPFPANPSIAIEAGRRSGEVSTTDYGIEIAQDLDLPQRRRARLDAAHA